MKLRCGVLLVFFSSNFAQKTSSDSSKGHKCSRKAGFCTSIPGKVLTKKQPLVVQNLCEEAGCCFKKAGYVGNHGSKKIPVGRCFNILDIETTSESTVLETTISTRVTTTTELTTPETTTTVLTTVVPTTLEITDFTELNSNNTGDPTGEINFGDYYYYDYKSDETTDNEDQRDQKLPRVLNVFDNGIPPDMTIDDIIDYVFQLNNNLEDEFDKMDENIKNLDDYGIDYYDTFDEKDPEFDEPEVISENSQFKPTEKPKTKAPVTSLSTRPRFARPSNKVDSVLYSQQWDMAHMCPETRNMMACCATDSPCCKFSGGRYNFPGYSKHEITRGSLASNSIGSMSLASSVSLPPVKLPKSSDSWSNLFSNGLQSRIVGGYRSKSDLRKHMAYIQYQGEVEPFCGGTLIHSRWVLTAAHCLLDYCQNTRNRMMPYDLVVRLGKWRKLNYDIKRNAAIRDPYEVVRYVSQVVCHHSQCRSDRTQPRLNDVGLLKLSSDVIYNDFVAPAPMPEKFTEPVLSKKCITLGWGHVEEDGTGSDEYLKEAQMKLWSNRQCNQRDWRDCSIRSCMMCAGEKHNRPCKGDSGGPLLCPHDGDDSVYVLHGVYSYGRCARVDKKPAVYSRVSFYMDWIVETLQKDNAI